MNSGSVGCALGSVGNENDEIWKFLLVLPDIDERPFNGGPSVQSVLTAQAHAAGSKRQRAEADDGNDDEVSSRLRAQLAAQRNSELLNPRLTRRQDVCVCVCVWLLGSFTIKFVVLFRCCRHRLISVGAHVVCLLRFLAIFFNDV